MSLLPLSQQNIFKINDAPTDGHAIIFRAYRGNECLKHRLRTGAKGEILIVRKSKLEKEGE